MGVNSGVAMRAELLLQIGNQFVHGKAFGRKQFKQHQPGGDAIAFGDVPGKTDAAAFLSAQQHAALEHFRANVFETNTRFDQRQIVRSAHLVHHRRGRQCFDDASPALAVHDEMMQ